MTRDQVQAALNWLRKVRRGYQQLPKAAQVAVWAAAAAGPVLAFSGGLGSGDDGASAATAASETAAPRETQSTWNADAPSSAGNGSFLRSAAGVMSVDIGYEMEKISRASAFDIVADDDDLDLDDALEILTKHIREASESGDVLESIRKSGPASKPALLLAHSLPLMANGDVWGAAANLLVAHERDEDDATPLVNLAAIANSQGLPAVALALVKAAGKRSIADDDSPAGIRERAALLNNRGHALILLGRYDDAAEPLRQALALSPELSEAARNLVHVLLKQGKTNEARALAPRAVWRLRGNPAKPVSVRSEAGKAAGDSSASAQSPAPAGSTQDIKAWADAPYLIESDGRAELPLWIALDLSRQGQIAWPEPIYPKPDASYVHYFPTASARYVAAGDAASALGQKSMAVMQSMSGKRMTLGDTIQQSIEVQVSPVWMLEPIDTEMHALDAAKENLILDSHEPTRFRALEVARAEYQMAQAADRFYERYYRDSKCPQGTSSEACCAIQRRENNRNIVEMTPIVREYEERMRVFFRDAYGLSTAIASNLPQGKWHDMARIDIEQDVQNFVKHTQQEIAFAFAHAAPGDACYGPASNPIGEAPDVEVDAPACSAASQWASGKWAFSNNFSMELTCGKLKVVAEVNVIGTRKLSWGPLNDIGMDLGMHAEAEFSMDGTVTIFAGPKGGIAGKVGGVGGDFGVKDGLYAVIGREGVEDVGFRVVVGGGVGGENAGGTHDVDSMDFSFASAI
jgi:tetratricopeptide (TPR) repeat protein